MTETLGPQTEELGIRSTELKSKIEEMKAEATSILTGLIALADEKGEFPKQRFIGHGEQLNSSRSVGEVKPALLVTTTRDSHFGNKGYLMLMGDGSMIRYSDKHTFPKKPNDVERKTNYGSIYFEVLTDFEYVTLTPLAVKQVMGLLPR